MRVEITCTDCGTRGQYQDSAGSGRELCLSCSSDCIEQLKQNQISLCWDAHHRLKNLSAMWRRHTLVANITIGFSFLLVIVLLVCGCGFLLSLLGLLAIPIYYLFVMNIQEFRLAMYLFCEAEHPMNRGSRNYYDALFQMRGDWNRLRQQSPELNDYELATELSDRWVKELYQIELGGILRGLGPRDFFGLCIQHTGYFIKKPNARAEYAYAIVIVCMQMGIEVRI